MPNHHLAFKVGLHRPIIKSIVFATTKGLN